MTRRRPRAWALGLGVALMAGSPALVERCAPINGPSIAIIPFVIRNKPSICFAAR